MINNDLASNNTNNNKKSPWFCWFLIVLKAKEAWSSLVQPALHIDLVASIHLCWPICMLQPAPFHNVICSSVLDSAALEVA